MKKQLLSVFLLMGLLFVASLQEKISIGFVARADIRMLVEQADKQLYTAPFGDVTNDNNQWSLSRSAQSNDWILFWEKGFGENVSVLSCGNNQVKVDDILTHAQIAFDFYTDSLKFIKRSTSLTSKYKMVILMYYTTDWVASGSGVDNTIGQLNLSTWAAASRSWQTLYHEIGHCFQYQVHCDNKNNNGWMYAIGSGCAFWEQCAQWQAYKIMPSHQFTNEWYADYVKNAHKHILHEAPRYNNYFIQDYWSYKHGVEIIGRLWNESKSPEDAVRAYMRITGVNINQFNDEMYDCAARFATWDIPALRSYGANYVLRFQPAMSLQDDNYWRIDSSVCVENTGYNIIRLNIPKKETTSESISDTSRTMYAYFEGLPGQSGYRQRNVSKAGWRCGFVALLKDGTRLYSDMGTASYANSKDTVRFDCPFNCKNLYFVVTGAPSYYWPHLWDDDDTNDEQWPYQVKFNQTNRMGYKNIVALDSPSLASSGVSIGTAGNLLHVHSALSDAILQVFDLQGRQVLNTTIDSNPYSTELQSGVYMVRVRVLTPSGVLVTKKVGVR